MARVDADDGFTWAELVSDGHVRAARLRWVQPWLIVIGVFALVIGFYIQSGVQAPIQESRTSDSLDAQVMAIRQPVLNAVKALPAISVTSEQSAKLVPSTEIRAAVIPLILSSLNRNGALPKDKAQFRELSVNDFWFRPWPTDALVSTGDGDVRLVGAIINYTSLSQAARWLGVFRKNGDRWQYETAETDQTPSGMISSRSNLSLGDIPLTLKPLIPKACLDGINPCPLAPDRGAF